MISREIADMHIIYSDQHVFSEMLKLLRRLHYNIIAVEGLKEQAIIEKEGDIRILKRITLEASNESEAKRKLRGIKQRYDIVALKPKSYGVARLAARDGRVDLIPVDEDTLKYVDLSEIRLLENSRGAFELSLSTLYRNRYNTRFIGILQKKIRLLIRYDAPIVVSSGARNMYELWHPKQVIGLLMLYGMSESKALEAISFIPLTILKHRVRV